ncbi:MAG: phosphoenolpyruvate--protein phosphotransferase [Deltaproteobacteria bacterium]|nr:phosphoenolpyruvate--protein phosphotransferase [Deltaproteobacteria bacterium]
MADKIYDDTVFKGLGVSPGIAIGKAFLFAQMEARAAYYNLADDTQIKNEIERLKQAIAKSIEQIEVIKTNLLGFEVKDPIYILEMYAAMLRDESFVERTTQNIRNERVNAEWAVGMTVDAYAEIFSKLDNDYIRSRISDVQDIGKRIIWNLAGEKQHHLPEGESPVIIVARDLSPADTAQMKIDRVQGFVTDMGSSTSHTTIVARSLEIPAVVGMEKISQAIRTNDTVIVDGTAGLVIVNPSPELIRRYEARRRDYLIARSEMLVSAKQPAITVDGYRMQIGCNIEFAEEIPSAIEHGAEGIGLYRTEFLYINRHSLASQEEHRINYESVIGVPPLEWATIRTFDLGGDKFFSDPKLAKEMNPQMGLRAIRFCLKEKEIFKEQLRAILGAAHRGTTRILFPMISGVEEIRETKKILNGVKTEILSQGVVIPQDIDIGIMIEVPSAVVMADELAHEVDFFSIGTNDLIQYALAIDRINEHVHYLYEPLHPAVLRLIRTVVIAGHKANIRVAMCGEMAGDPLNTLILLALRIDELSMYPLAIPRVKKIIRRASLQEADALFARVIHLSSAKEIRGLVEEYMWDNFADILPARDV